jgi:hypothetical protein
VVAIMLAGRAGAAVLAGLGVPVSRSTVLRVLMALPVPQAPVPEVSPGPGGNRDQRPHGRRRPASCSVDTGTVISVLACWMVNAAQVD